MDYISGVSKKPCPEKKLLLKYRWLYYRERKQVSTGTFKKRKQTENLKCTVISKWKILNNL